MSDPNAIQNLVKKVNADPKTIDALLKPGSSERGSQLKSYGASGFTRGEVAEQLQKILVSKMDTNRTEARPVEWAGVIATLAAGALAA